MASYEMMRQLAQADREERRQQREAEAEAEARADQREAQVRQFAAEHGCSPGEWAQRAAAMQERQDEAAAARAAEAARERHQEYLSGLLMAGRTPHTLEQVLDIARVAG